MDKNPFAQFGYDDGSGVVTYDRPADAAPQPKSVEDYDRDPSPPLTITPKGPAPNPFAKFGFDDGSGQPGSAPVPSSPHPGGVLSNDPGGDSWASGAAKGTATAAIKGVGDTLGFAGNLHQGLDYAENWIESKFTGETPEQVGARRQAAFQAARTEAANRPGIAGLISRGAQADTPPDVIGKDISNPVLAKTGEYVPSSEPGRVGMAAVEAGVGSVGPGMGAAAGPSAVKTAVAAVPSMAASGAAGQGAADLTHSPIAGMVAGVAVPGSFHVADNLVRGHIVDAVRSRVGTMDGYGFQGPITDSTGARIRDSYGAPLTATKTQASIAGDRIEGRATDPQAVRDNLANGIQELIPGSTPTTFQQTGDMGLGQLERQVSLGAADRFNQRFADQNAARVQTISSLQPDASPADVANHFRNVRDAMDTQNASDLAAADQARRDAARNVGGTNTSPETVGANLRDPLVAARAAAKENENRLWDAVDPTGKMVMPTAPIADAAKRIAGEMTPSATPMAGEEARLFDVASKYGPQTSFREVTQLRSSISTALRQATQAGDTQAVRRLTGLRGSVEQAIDGAVENQAAQDQGAVRSGALAPEDAMEARMREIWGVDGQVQQAGRQRLDATTGLARTGTGAGRFASARAGAAPRDFGAGGEGGSGFPAPSSDPGVPPPPFLDAEASDRLKAASAATRARVRTYDEGVIGKVLGPGSHAGSFDASDATVGRTVFHPGSTGGEDMRAYYRAGGSQDAATVAAASSLRQAAIRPDGTFDPKSVSNWIRAHQPAIAELPDGVRERFQHSIDAQTAYDDVVAAQKAQASAQKRSAVAPFLGLTDPSSVTRQVGSIFEQKNAAETMGDLARRTADDPTARDGLRRSVVDYIQGRFLGNEAATSGIPQLKGQNFISWWKQAQPALRKVFSQDETNKLAVIAQDLERAQRSAGATRLNIAGSDTAQNAILIKPWAPSKSILYNIASQAVLMGAGHMLAGPIGAIAGWFGPKGVGSLRDAGITRVDNLVTEAMLNPNLAKALLDRAPSMKDRGTAATLALRARQLVANQAQATDRDKPTPRQ